MTGMVLRRALPEAPSSVTVRPVTDLAGFHAQMRIMRRCFGGGAPDPTEDEAAAEMERRRGREPQRRRYLAYEGDRPVAAGNALLIDGAVVLCGGATLPEARGRGAYRALLGARFHDAVARGTPALVVQAGSMSRPILERLGFERVATVRLLVDRPG
jgi:hypothetical protein